MNNANLFDLSGKIALVTGSSRGIGESIARALAANGALVIVSSRKLDDCRSVAESIRASGGRAEARACDIGSMEQVDALFGDIAACHGRLDILVNNAGIMRYFGPIEETDPASFQKTLDVNVRGYFFCSAHAVKLMKKNGGGSIINIASINAVSPIVQQGIYSVSKAAVVSMTKAFAAEVASSKIRVNALLPGATETRLAAPMLKDKEMLDAFLPTVPMRRMGKPEEMAGAVLYFASDASSYTTGACLTVDGGKLL